MKAVLIGLAVCAAGFVAGCAWAIWSTFIKDDPRGFCWTDEFDDALWTLTDENAE